MSDLLTTLPGDIPGLLQDGAILRYDGRRAVAVQVNDGFVLVAHHASGADEETEVEGGTVSVGDVALDLTARTSRAQVGQWLNNRRLHTTFLEQYTVDDAACGRDMTPKQIDELARLVLRLAGRQS